MNTGLTLAAIFFLLLVLTTAGEATKRQADASYSTATCGQNLNHNETLVHDNR